MFVALSPPPSLRQKETMLCFPTRVFCKPQCRKNNIRQIFYLYSLREFDSEWLNYFLKQLDSAVFSLGTTFRLGFCAFSDLRNTDFSLKSGDLCSSSCLTQSLTKHDSHLIHFQPSQQQKLVCCTPAWQLLDCRNSCLMPAQRLRPRQLDSAVTKQTEINWQRYLYTVCGHIW